MKINILPVLGLLLAAIFLPGMASAAPGDIPSIGNVSGPSSAGDITEGLGIFAAMGQFVLKYAVHIAIFVMTLAAVVLSMRGSWSRANNKVDEAVEVQKNQKGLIVDGLLTMAGLLFIFFILAPFVKSFI